MENEIPARTWSDTYRAFPELQQLGEDGAIKLLKAIIANELEHYGPEDLTQDGLAQAGLGATLKGKTIGFAQVTPDGLKRLARDLDSQVSSGYRESNPLHRFANMKKEDIAKELAKPANAPLFVAAITAHNVHLLNAHKNEVNVTPEALGYQFNADCVYAKTDKTHSHLLTKKEAARKHISNDSALPTDDVLKKSEHARNIRTWLKKVD